MIKRILQGLIGFVFCILSSFFIILGEGVIFAFGICMCAIGALLFLSASWKIKE